ncbi:MULTISPECIES: hypothetical protein [unclassified Rhizobium]|uniref:hypothetical protein n=1 Tax=unclassified Rhizobium TaxID=2613769 RepID=UPI0006FF09B1|nr:MULTISPECIES: hypothetical protein [unclassified Rhizobium]KQV36201.1 hypothetical protein ASC86_24880 [Rhizobium sp. Root1212]KRD25272.1 hypothetical protein ASE37_24850 [Rhizobium sp. Root268]
MKKQNNRQKVAEIIEAAQKLSTVVIEQEGKSDRSGQNLERISALAKLLLTATPPLEPTYDNLVERGKLLYPNFLARQTLKNRYRMMVGVWRGAFHSVQHLLADQAIKAAMDHQIPSATASDAGGTIHILREYIVRIRAEMDQLKHELSDAKASLSLAEGSQEKSRGSNGLLDGEIVA